MHPTLRRPKAAVLAALLSLTGLLFFSCQKQLTEDISGGNLSSDISTKVTASVSGFVVDENNNAVQNAAVQFGNQSTVTDKYGYFSVASAEVAQNAAFVSVTKAGYFKGIKTFIAQKTKKAFFRIKLIPKNLSGTISGSSGGTVTLSNGLSISLPANAVVIASGGAAYAGTVNVAAYHINPNATDLDMIMPGDLRGINTDGDIKLLKTYGMAAVELTGASGELLQIASGKKATLTMPIPSSLLGDAPSSIPLWYFDETKGLWKEEGSATKTGSNYVGDVAHFSYWNCDYPFPQAVIFDVTVVNSNGIPIPGANVWIDYASGSPTGCHGYTDPSGFAQGPVPANSQLVMKIYDPACINQTLYSQPFTTSTTNYSMGTVSVSISVAASITGNLVNCSGQPVTNGYLMLHSGTYWTRYNVTSSSGNFSISTMLCSVFNFDIIPGDITGGQEGALTSLNLVPGNNPLGTLTACGNTNAEFFNYSINGNPVSITAPTSYLAQQPDSILVNAMRITGWHYQSNDYIELRVSTQGMAVGSSQNIIRLVTSTTSQTTIPSPVNVTITELGAIGQFIAGNFSGNFISGVPPNNPCTISGSFRMRRQY